MLGVLPAARLHLAAHDGGVVVDDDAPGAGVPVYLEISVIVGRAEEAIDPQVTGNPDVGAADDPVLAGEVAPDGEKAGLRVDLPVEDGAVDDKVVLNPVSCDTILAQLVEIDIALDPGIAGVVAHMGGLAASRAVIIKMAVKLQALGDIGDRELFEC
jgi:hypothetical protein